MIFYFISYQLNSHHYSYKSVQKCNKQHKRSNPTVNSLTSVQLQNMLSNVRVATNFSNQTNGNYILVKIPAMKTKNLSLLNFQLNNRKNSEHSDFHTDASFVQTDILLQYIPTNNQKD